MKKPKQPHNHRHDLRVEVVMKRGRFNGYKQDSRRAEFWDYNKHGTYFITINTKCRKHFFGEIRNGVMLHSGIGMLVREFWMNIPFHFDYVQIDEFVEMPDHFHGIIAIQPKDDLSFGVRNRLLGNVVGLFKGSVTRYGRKYFEPKFAWQPRFHDSIIKSQWHLKNVQAYIQNNEKNWKCAS